MIDERKAMMAKWGDDWQDKPVCFRFDEGVSVTRSFSHLPRQSDLLQWILDIAVPEKETDFDIAARLMSINLASIHTTSMVSQEVSSARILQVFDCSSAQSVTIALFLLAQNPEYIEPLRAEIR